MTTLPHIPGPVQPGLPTAFVAFSVGLAPSPRPARVRSPRGGCKVAGRFYRGGCYCPAFDRDNPHELPAVEIKGALYLVQPIDAGECGVSAVRLTKLVNGESYDVIRRHDDLVECSCPDFLYRHDGKGTCCKHGAACMVHGLLPVAPIVEAAPEIPAEAPEGEGPAWTWDAWTDRDTWELGPDEDGPSPTWDAERFEPEDIAAAYEAGYQLGLEGEYPRPPAHFSPREAYHFNCGRLAGFIASPEGRSWYRDMETLEDRPDGRPADLDVHPRGAC